MSDLFNEQCQEITGFPGWEWDSMRVNDSTSGDIYEIVGAVSPRLMSGPRKGRANWKMRDRSTERKLFLLKKDVDVWREAWSARTGKCITCEGDGKTFHSWNVETGVKFNVCKKCNGSGLRVQKEAK